MNHSRHHVFGWITWVIICSDKARVMWIIWAIIYASMKKNSSRCSVPFFSIIMCILLISNCVIGDDHVLGHDINLEPWFWFNFTKKSYFISCILCFIDLTFCHGRFSYLESLKYTVQMWNQCYTQRLSFWNSWRSSITNIAVVISRVWVFRCSDACLHYYYHRGF